MQRVDRSVSAHGWERGRVVATSIKRCEDEAYHFVLGDSLADVEIESLKDDCCRKIFIVVSGISSVVLVVWWLPLEEGT